VVLLNAAYALLASAAAKNTNSAIALAERSIDSGRAMEKLNKLKNFKHI